MLRILEPIQPSVISEEIGAVRLPRCALTRRSGETHAPSVPFGLRLDLNADLATAGEPVIRLASRGELRAQPLGREQTVFCSGQDDGAHIGLEGLHIRSGDLRRQLTVRRSLPAKRCAG